MGSTDWPVYAFLLILLGLSAFFSAVETALSSVNLMRLRGYAEDGDKRAKNALKLTEQFDRTLSTILIGNNVVNIASASLATVVATELFGSSGVAIATGVTTLLVLTFGEILPKSWAKENSEKMALLTASTVLILVKVLSPLSWFFLKLKRLFARAGSGDNASTPTMTEQELLYMIEAIEEEGVLEEQESELVQSALEFDEITVQEILTPRVDVFALDIRDDFDDMVEDLLTQRYSRVPVFENSIDNIKGIVRARDVLECKIHGKHSPLTALLTPTMYIHKTMKLSNLLGEFQKSKNHMAIVTDDYGGTLGIVTLEDVLEQLVGDIWDEKDEVVNDIKQTGDASYEITGDANLYEFFEEIGKSTKTLNSDYNTMAGFVTELLARIPQVGDSLVYENMHITVTEMDEQRIIKLTVELVPIGQESEQE